ncbi:MAG: helix-turn-helix domain-containing protein [Anaerolineae bacterium]
MNEEESLNVRQVAEYLQLKTSTVYTWAQEGKIPATKIGRTWQFLQEEIDRWLEQHLVESDS